MPARYAGIVGVAAVDCRLPRTTVYRPSNRLSHLIRGIRGATNNASHPASKEVGVGIRVRVVVDSYCLKGPVLLLSDIESLMMPYKSEPYLFWCAPKTVTVRSSVFHGTISSLIATTMVTTTTTTMNISGILYTSMDGNCMYV